MYVRSRKPAAGTASASVSRYDTSSARYISTERARYGATELAMSSMPRPRLGRAYGARAFSQNGRSAHAFERGAAPITVTASDARAPFTLAAERAAGGTAARREPHAQP
jgi:hypothetical protein